LNGTATLRRVPLEGDPDPGRILALLVGRDRPFALVGEWAGGGAILGSDPLRAAGPGEDPFAVPDRLPRIPDGGGAGDAVGGGWFGWLGYGAGARIEDLPPQPPRPYPLPEAHLAWYDNVLRLDRAGQWWFEALVTPEREAALDLRQKQMERLLAGAAAKAEDRPDFTPPASFRPAGPGEAGHVAAVARCRERIAAGEFFQANLRVRFEAEWDGDLAALFGVAAAKTSPAFGAVFLTPESGIASLSPELFLRRRGDLVETGPIKGTARRPDDRASAESARNRLTGSEKDAAEHIMIVDVARSDLGRVCSFGTVTAPDHPEAEAHPGVWHLVSRVRGELAPGVRDSDLLRATFPPCSVTGAPKIQAMRAIASLEPLGREVFTGAVGFAGPVAGLEMSVAIRTFEAANGRLWLDAGGGIVSDSDPARELEECLDKARPLVEAIGSRIEPADGIAPPQDRGDIPWALDGGSRHRPDPARGVFETIAVSAGAARHLEQHLERLARSLDLLYGARTAGRLAERVGAAASKIGDGALRIVASPDGSSRITPRALPERELPVALTPFILPGGFGPHKWADRRLADALAADGPTPLLIDSDGTVLEAAWGNIWIVENGNLLTPPADGRILPGVTRQAVLDTGSWRRMPVREQPFGLARLAAADSVMVSSSLAGLVLAVPVWDA